MPRMMTMGLPKYKHNDITDRSDWCWRSCGTGSGEMIKWSDTYAIIGPADDFDFWLTYAYPDEDDYPVVGFAQY